MAAIKTRSDCDAQRSDADERVLEVAMNGARGMLELRAEGRVKSEKREKLVFAECLIPFPADPQSATRRVVIDSSLFGQERRQHAVEFTGEYVLGNVPIRAARLGFGTLWVAAFCLLLFPSQGSSWRLSRLGAGGSLVYFYDEGTGVWRSMDAGKNWTLIWNKTSKSNISGSLAGSFAVAGDTTRLFVATQDGLYRLDHADTGDPVGSPSGAIVVTKLDVPNPGRLAAEGETLWVTGKASPSGTEDVVLRKSTDGGITFTTFADNYYEGAACWPRGLAVEPGFQYTAASTMSTIVSDR